MEKILYFFSNKRMQQKNKILEDIIDNILGCLKEKYSPRYFYQPLTLTHFI